MLTVDANAVAAQNNTTGMKSAVGNDEVSQEQFLKLLVAQLQHQDPLNPTENQEFVAELATFSSLEQQQQQTALLEQLIQAQGATNTSQALSLIGKDVVVSEDRFQFRPGETLDFVFDAKETGAATIEISTASGAIVDAFQVSATRGQNNLRYDGVIADGVTLPPDIYNIKISSSVDESGDRTGYDTYLRGNVDGVTFVNGSPVLTVNGQPVEMSYVQSVFENKD